MEITVHLPDDLAMHPDPGREALESLVLEGYRSGKLSAYQARQILSLSRFDFEAFLKSRNIEDYAYGLEELEEDRAAIRQLLAKGTLQE